MANETKEFKVGDKVSLTGTVKHLHGPQVEIEVGGTGYRVHTSALTIVEAAPAEKPEKAAEPAKA